jgi:hypothetical protein
MGVLMSSSQSSWTPAIGQSGRSAGPPATPERLPTYDVARVELTEKLIAQGVHPTRAERVAEATIRRARAKAGRTVFYYADVEYQFEERCRNTGADPSRIEASKHRVWTAARATAETHGCAIEEALFFCYQEGLDVHREFLVAVAASDEETPADDTGL